MSLTYSGSATWGAGVPVYSLASSAQAFQSDKNRIRLFGCENNPQMSQTAGSAAVFLARSCSRQEKSQRLPAAV